MNGLIDDPTADGWMALCISVLRGVPPDEAFKMLEDPRRKKIKWTPEMFGEVEEMREQGMTWGEIAELYNVHKTSICRLYNRYKGKEIRDYQRRNEKFYLKIDTMRKQHIKWDDISKEMGIDLTKLRTSYNYWKKKKE